MTQLLPRFTQPTIHSDPLEIAIAAKTAREDAARAAIAAGAPPASATDLRGIPVQARGVGGTSPGTHPLYALMSSEPHATLD